jgi:hypothetical protein
MEPLGGALVRDGLVDEAALAQARRHAEQGGGELDTALLELDLLDEESLGAALAAAAGLPAARPADATGADPAVAARVPPGVAATFRLCPVREEDGGLVALVASPLPPRWEQELRELFGLAPRQLVAPAHYLAVARAAVYGVALDARAAALEERLRRRRAAPAAAAVAAQMAAAATLEAAAEVLLGHAARYLEHGALCRRADAGLAPWLWRGSAGAAAAPALLPVEPGCAFAAAALHGGYFLGPVGDTPAHRRFYDHLGRTPPARAFVAPVPGAAVVFYGDNGDRGLAARWIAELTLLVARLAQWRPPRALDVPAPAVTPKDGFTGRRGVGEVGIGPDPDRNPSSLPVSSPPCSSVVSVSLDDIALLERLRAAATAAGVTPAALLDELLTRRAPPAPPPPAPEPGADMRGLLERLAADIPAQFARGVESAFRDMLTRLPLAAAPAPLAGPAPAPAPAAAAPLVVTAAPAPAARAVADYRSRRRKLEQVKF